MVTKTIKIPNFKLSTFKQLLSQSLMVDNQLMLNFNDKLVKSCSFSSTKSFIKLWTITLQSLIVQPEKIVDVDDLDNNDNQFKMEPFEFDCYILKGDSLNKFLSVYNADTVDLEFTIIQKDDGKWQAKYVCFNGIGSSNSNLKTTFILTMEEMISNKIDDYAEILKQCTPSKNVFEYIFSSKQIEEIKRLVKNLHKTIADNSAYLTFQIDVQNKKIIVNDKVFELDIPIVSNNTDDNYPTENFSFNILKSDFVIAGNHDFSFYVNNDEQKIILGAKYANAIVWCLATKIQQNAIMDSAAVEATIDSLEISEYF